MYMIVRGRGIGTDSTRSKMPCESCAVQFSVFRRKRACTECDRYYCSGCLRRGGGAMCAPCRVLSTRPLSRANIAHLKVRDLQCFLQRQNVSTRGCVEKEELVSLCVSLVNNASYRRRGSRAGAGARTGAFSSLKGLTNNINDFINTAFDIRCTPQRASPPPTHNCHNSSHAHTPPGNAGPAPPQRERFNPTPDSEVLMSAPEAAATSHSRPAWSPGGIGPGPREARARPRDADVEPHEAEAGLARASSELELRRSESVATDTASLQDEPLMDHDNGTPKHITLEQMKQPSDLEALNVKQLKELLTRNRVEYRGCIERADLLNRAMMLWRDHTQYKDELDNLPIEECCKICMAAPLECVLLECGHIAACTACSKQLAECPICRQYVVRAVRVFRS